MMEIAELFVISMAHQFQYQKASAVSGVSITIFWKILNAAITIRLSYTVILVYNEIINIIIY